MTNRQLFVVAYIDDDTGKPFNANDKVWTLSFEKDECGWTTDCGYPGYGLSKEIAEAIAKVWNDALNKPPEAK